MFQMMIFYFSLWRLYPLSIENLSIEGFSVEGKWMLARCERYFFLWKYKLFPWEMNVFTFWAIFLLLKSDTSGPFSIMRFSALLKLNLSFSIPLNNQQKNFSGNPNSQFRGRTMEQNYTDPKEWWPDHYQWNIFSLPSYLPLFWTSFTRKEF